MIHHAVLSEARDLRSCRRIVPDDNRTPQRRAFASFKRYGASRPVDVCRVSAVKPVAGQLALLRFNDKAGIIERAHWQALVEQLKPVFLHLRALQASIVASVTRTAMILILKAS